MINELTAIAEAHEASELSQSIAVLKVQVKGKEVPLNIPKNGDPDSLANNFVRHHKLPLKSSAVLASKIKDIMQECEKTSQSKPLQTQTNIANGSSNFLGNLLHKKGGTDGIVSKSDETPRFKPSLSSVENSPPPAKSKSAADGPKSIGSEQTKSSVEAAAQGDEDDVLATLSIRIGENLEAALSIRRDCDPEEVAASFVRTHNLPASAQSTLASKVREIIAAGGEGGDDSDDESVSDVTGSGDESEASDGESSRLADLPNDSALNKEEEDPVTELVPFKTEAKPIAPASTEVTKNRPILDGFRQLSSVFKKKSSTESAGAPTPSPLEQASIDSHSHAPHQSGNLPPAARSDDGVLATLSIRIGENLEAALSIRRGCDPEEVAASFVRTHNLPASAQSTLASKVREVIAAGGEGGDDSASESGSDVSVSDDSSQDSVDEKEAPAEEESPSGGAMEVVAEKRSVMGPVRSLSAFFGKNRKSSSEKVEDSPKEPPKPISPIHPSEKLNDMHSLHSKDSPAMSSTSTAKSTGSLRKYSLGVRVSDESKGSDSVVFYAKDDLLDVAARFADKHSLPSSLVSVLVSKMEAMLTDDDSVRTFSSFHKKTAVAVAAGDGGSQDRQVRRDSDASRNAYNAAKLNWGEGGSVSSRTPSNAPRARTENTVTSARGRERESSAPATRSRSTGASDRRRISSSSMVVGKSTRARSSSPGGAHSDTFERLYKDAAVNKDRYEKFKERIELQKAKELEREARQAKKHSFSSKIGDVRQRSRSAGRPGMNPGEVMFERGQEWMKTRDRNSNRIKASLEQDSTKELTFHPSVNSGPEAEGRIRSGVINGKQVSDFHTALYEIGMQQNQKKLLLEEKRRKEVEELSLDFTPHISEHSANLARKRRNRRFHGAAVATVVTQDTHSDLAVPLGVKSGDAAKSCSQPTEEESKSADDLLGRSDADEESKDGQKPKNITRRSCKPSHPSRAGDKNNAEKPRSASADLSTRRSRRPNIFDQLYEGRKENERARQNAAEKHVFKSDFSPHTGKTSPRLVKPDVGVAASERLYMCRHRKEELQQKIIAEEMKRVRGKDPSQDKKLRNKDVENLLKRFEDAEKKSKQKETLLQEKELQLESVGSPSKLLNVKSDRIATKKRRAALEEIFTVLLYTVEMKRKKPSKAKQSSNLPRKESREGEDSVDPRVRDFAVNDWEIAKAGGEEAYEMCPLPSPREGEQESTIHLIRPPAPSPIEGSSASEMTPSKNLLHQFDSAGGHSPPPPPPPLPSSAHPSSTLPTSGNKYFFRAEALAKKRRKVPNGGQDDDSLPHREVRCSAETFDLDEARSKDTEGEAVADKWGSRKQGRLLDCSLADASLLKPPALSEVVAMVLQTCRPSLISRDEFVEVFEVLSESGLTAPMNMILTGGSDDKRGGRRKKKLTSEDLEYVNECREKPILNHGKRAVMLREKTTDDKTAPHDRLLKYQSVIEKKKELAILQLEKENEKELTFKPVIYSKKRTDKLVAKIRRSYSATKELTVVDAAIREKGEPSVGFSSEESGQQ